MSGLGMSGIYHRGIGNDTHHKGTGQAGNKSLLGYRYDTGVPGYTGFIPGGAVLSLPTKGSTMHTGKPPSDVQIERVAGLHTLDNKTSEYQSTFKAQSRDYHPSRDGGGQWQAQRFGEVVADAKVYNGTTYQDEMQHSAAAAALAHSLAEGLRPTLAMETQAQKQVLAGTRKASKELGYTSVYTSMVVKDPLTGGSAAAGRARAAPGSPVMDPAPRERVIRRAVSPHFHGDTMYTQHYGARGSDPMDRFPRHESQMSAMASTKELNLGTHKAANHIPGYSGFIPTAQTNPEAVLKGSLERGRDDAKANMLLCSMDQYSRHNLPKYGCFRPQAVVNAHAELLPPNTRTHQGAVNQEVWAKDLRLPDKTNNLTSKDGTQSFFTGGAGAVSENGKSLAQCYYLAVRPKEGLPRIHHPSKTTHWGGSFH
mmetsp:Transcript_43206/g.82425  ORF Transcript_43206/g.82425 Transcript_43206/m.82425 type:complete len:425 (-) Transcript_43206:282-1556(-)